MKKFLIIILLVSACDSIKESEKDYPSDPIVSEVDVEKSNLDTLGAEDKLKLDEFQEEAPLIEQGYCEVIPPPPNGRGMKIIGSADLDKKISYEGKVCIDAKEFSGYSPYNIPFVANVMGQVEELYVDNKKVKFTGQGEIFFRQKIHLESGYNRIPVRVVGKSGKSREGFIEITIS